MSRQMKAILFDYDPKSFLNLSSYSGNESQVHRYCGVWFIKEDDMREKRELLADNGFAVNTLVNVDIMDALQYQPSIERIYDYSHDCRSMLNNAGRILHLLNFMGYMGIKLGRISTEDVLGDRGVLHEFTHMLRHTYMHNPEKDTVNAPHFIEMLSDDLINDWNFLNFTYLQDLLLKLEEVLPEFFPPIYRTRDGYRKHKEKPSAAIFDHDIQYEWAINRGYFIK